MFVLWQRVRLDAGGQTVPTCVSAGAVLEAVTLWVGSATVRRVTWDHTVNKVCFTSLLFLQHVVLIEQCQSSNQIICKSLTLFYFHLPLKYILFWWCCFPVVKSVLRASSARPAATDASVRMTQFASMWVEPVLVYQAGLEHTVKNVGLSSFNWLQYSKTIK